MESEVEKRENKKVERLEQKIKEDKGKEKEKMRKWQRRKRMEIGRILGNGIGHTGRFTFKRQTEGESSIWVWSERKGGTPRKYCCGRQQLSEGENALTNYCRKMKQEEPDEATLFQKYLTRVFTGLFIALNLLSLGFRK